MAKMSASLAMAIVAIATALSGGRVEAQNVARVEVQPIQTVTLKTAQILTGDMNGAPVTVTGELRIPKPGLERLPAIILIHGSGGVGRNVDAWATEINSLGVAVFILDTFTGRGIVNTGSDQSQLGPLAMMIDAYRALAWLAQHPRIDPGRIAVIGFSRGAVAAVYSSNERFRKLYGPATVGFAAHIGLYTPCNVHYRDDDKVGRAPIRLFHGIADDYVSIAPCRDYVDRLKRAGADAILTGYPDAYHAYDITALSPPIAMPGAQTTRNCILQEGDSGLVLNAKTGAIFAYAPPDPCIEYGPHVGYNQAAYEATVKAVREFQTATFKLSSCTRAKLRGDAAKVGRQHDQPSGTNDRFLADPTIQLGQPRMTVEGRALPPARGGTNGSDVGQTRSSWRPARTAGSGGEPPHCSAGEGGAHVAGVGGRGSIPIKRTSAHPFGPPGEGMFVRDTTFSLATTNAQRTAGFRWTRRLSPY